MPEFLCSYAYDVSCYADFRVRAGSRKEAEAICEKALADGRFVSVEAEPFWENVDSFRTFVQDPVTPKQGRGYPTLRQLTGRAGITRNKKQQRKETK